MKWEKGMFAFEGDCELLEKSMWFIILKNKIKNLVNNFYSHFTKIIENKKILTVVMVN